MVKNWYPIPLPKELIDLLAGKHVFRKIKLRSGSCQMPIMREDKKKTAFRTCYGHYEFKVVAFGLVNASPQFMTVMNDILV